MLHFLAKQAGYRTCLLMQPRGIGFLLAGRHELDPVFRKITLQNERLKALVRDLRFHRDPVGVSRQR